MYLRNKRALGRTGAPDKGGVAPGMNVLVKGGGAFVGIPRLILAKGGMVVLVSRGGREVMVAEPSIKAETGQEKMGGEEGRDTCKREG